MCCYNNICRPSIKYKPNVWVMGLWCKGSYVDPAHVRLGTHIINCLMVWLYCCHVWLHTFSFAMCSMLIMTRTQIMMTNWSQMENTTALCRLTDKCNLIYLFIYDDLEMKNRIIKLILKPCMYFSYYLRALAVFDTITLLATLILEFNDLTFDLCLTRRGFLSGHNWVTCKLSRFFRKVYLLYTYDY